LSRDIFARNDCISKQTLVLRLSQCRPPNKCIKLTIANCYIFSGTFVTSFSRQKCSNSKNKKHTICKNDMFYVYGKFCRNWMKIKEIKARWRFGMHFCQAWVEKKEYIGIFCFLRPNVYHAIYAFQIMHFCLFQV
jgi:hypothetical protein